TIENAPQDLAYWMVPGEENASRKPGNVQGRYGYVLARVSGGVYDQAKDAFAGIEELTENLEKKGFGISSERMLVNGYPILFLEARKDANVAKSDTMFVATNVESSAVVVTYRPPDSGGNL